jgi:apolipoprotein N-acyltransferase
MVSLPLQKKSPLFLYAILSGILLTAAWPVSGSAALLFIGFVPLLILESKVGLFNSRKVFYASYLAFFCWNAGTTWWIYNSSLGGAIMAIVFNTFFMAMVFVFYHQTKSALGCRIGYASFILYWVGFEYLHLNWDLSWPWLTLGNGFATNIRWIQWYEYSGVLGGSVWVLLLNLFLYKAIFYRIQKKPMAKFMVVTIVLIVVPISISLYRYASYTEVSHPVKVVVVQPNIDPYTEKFGTMTSSQQLDLFLKQAITRLDSSTDYLVGPETAVPDGIWEDRLYLSKDLQTLKKFNATFPKLKTVIGITSNKVYKKGEAVSETARQYPNDNNFYDSYNTGIQISNTDSMQLYHKSKLVIGVEMIPYPFLFKYFEKLAINLGGTTGSLGVQDERGVFTAVKPAVKVAPVICYESIYGGFVTGYIRKGANLIFILTNDGWWGNTPGYKQHLAYASLRAIENRRSIARSANTGTSCFINQRGDISQATTWWTPTAISGILNTNDTLTFYSKHGDIIGKLCGIFSLFLLPIAWIAGYRKKKIIL